MVTKRKQYIALLKRIVKRLIALRKRTKLVLFLAVILCSSLFSQLYATLWAYPNTYLGREKISGHTASSIDAEIDRLMHLSYRMQIQNRSYAYTLQDLGVIIDKDQVKSLIFSPNTKPFPLNTIALLKSFFVSRVIPVPLVFTQEFNNFIERSIFDFSETESDTVLFDSTAKTLSVVENEEKYRIDESYFKTLLADRVGNTTIPLYPKLVKLQNARVAVVVDTAARIKDIFLEPLTVYVDASGNVKTFVLTEKELTQLTRIRLSEDQTTVEINLFDDIASRLITDHVNKLGFITKDPVFTPKVKEDLLSVIHGRFQRHTIDGLTLTLDKGPNTTGTTASKYIEVDISQQKMYLFKDGKLTKSYRVSTGLEYPTPVGEFTILNKVGLGYSNIYDVWMPYWMGFKYSDELRAYFGIHELPYTLTGDQKIHRPGDFIGRPNTGGCVALGVGDAKEVYQFADVGTVVVIFP